MTSGVKVWIAAFTWRGTAEKVIRDVVNIGVLRCCLLCLVGIVQDWWDEPPLPYLLISVIRLLPGYPWVHCTTFINLHSSITLCTMAAKSQPQELSTAYYDLPTPDPDPPLHPRKPYRFSTLCATVENPGIKDQYGSSSVPIYQTATFKGVSGEYDYTRSGNPTRSHLGEHSWSKLMW